MGKDGKGWVKFHREQWEHWITRDKPFCKGYAWNYLCSYANHENNKIPMDGNLIDIKRGQFITSIKKLSEVFGWSRHKVSDFLNLLEQDTMIHQKRTSKKTLITIVNYSYYQGKELGKGHQKDIKRTSKGHQKDTTKKDKELKNIKKEKKKYAEFIFLTKNEHQELVKLYGEINTKKFIEKLDNYKGATGKKYKSDYRAILNWVIEEVLGKEKISNDPYQNLTKF